jgi:uncharacterized protein YyaL (SSP411 family)
MTNHLVNETSPYLQQHAYNPVDWYPWSTEALQRSVEEGKPILLSIGYAACHWCHVMEKESFENPDIAAVMNKFFINIKVDREERPDLDSIYMQAVQGMTGRGGWPMTVFLTPELKPFFSGTYFPPEDRGGLLGFRRLLLALADAYATRPTDVLEAAEQVTAFLHRNAAIARDNSPLSCRILDQGAKQMDENFDRQFGGFGGAPKFPQPMNLEFLLRTASRTGRDDYRNMVELTLDKMASGGIYDQLGGGFHRYSVDDRWMVPHFEKMLYDNALLSRLYLHAFQATGRPEFRCVVENTLGYLLRDMRGGQGGFASSLDADVDGVEGQTYLWSKQQILDCLGREDGLILARYFGVTEQGNFEGQNILHVSVTIETLAAEYSIPVAAVQDVLHRGIERMRDIRSQRLSPPRDDKILTAWNAMVISALAEAGIVFERSDYLVAARRTAEFLLASLRRGERLLRTYRDGVAKLPGYLEDYAFLIDALLTLYEATLERIWLDHAHSLATAMVDLFWDASAATFFDTARDHEELLVRPRDVFDNALPSGSSMAAIGLFRLGAILEVQQFTGIGEQALLSVQSLIERYPTGFGNWLCALDLFLSEPKQVAIFGRRADPDMMALLSAAHAYFLPNKVVVGAESSDETSKEGIPLLYQRSMVNGKATAYVCRNNVCMLPVNEPSALLHQMGMG